MFIRTFVMIAACCGGLLAAQFPAFSQQYMQRLGGAVEALEQVVADFDASAAALGLSRSEALGQMRGTAFIEARRTDMQRTFLRHEILSADLATLEGLGPFMRAYHISHLTDRDIAKGAWGAFEPALPLSFASVLFALFGFGATAMSLWIVFALIAQRPKSPAMPA